MSKRCITENEAIEAACNAGGFYQEMENVINRLVDDVIEVTDNTEIVDLRAKYQALIAEKYTDSGDAAETYTAGYRYGHRNGQIELLQQILNICDGVSESENEL